MSGGGHGGLFTVHGMGGHIDVFADRIEIHRHGLLHMLWEILNLYEGSTDLTIPIDRITSVAIIDPWLEPGYIRFTYAGSPAYTKHFWADAMTPSTLLTGYFDMRGFHRLREFIIATQNGGLRDARGHGPGDHESVDHETRVHEPRGHRVGGGDGSGEAPEAEPDSDVVTPSAPAGEGERRGGDAEAGDDWRDRYRTGDRGRYIRGWRPET